MIRARIRVGWEVGGGLQALLGAPLAACSGCAERDGGIRHGKRRSRTGTGASLPGRSVGRTLGQWRTGRQAGSGMARSRARARLNWVSQGQRWGRCRVSRRAERVSREIEDDALVSLLDGHTKTPAGPRRFCANFSTRWPLWGVGDPHT